jgi:tetratricopeptide (TPR) repeat protein
MSPKLLAQGNHVIQVRPRYLYPRRSKLPLLIVSSVLALFAVPAQCQRPGGTPAGAPQGSPNPSTGGNSGILTNMGILPVTVTVNVREANGMPLEGHAFVKLFSKVRNFNLTNPTQENSSATFNDVHPGDYEIEVTCAGYKTAIERVSMVGGGSTYPVFVYLHSEAEAAALKANAPANVVMTPKLQAELDKGFEKMRKQQYDAAREHFERAAKLAPGNPDVQYLLGTVANNQKHFDLARTRFESALSLNPAHERSLLAIGELQLRAGESSAAARTLEKAFLVNGADWRTHFLLAQAYNSEKDYAKAAFHATRAAELGGSKAAQPLLLLGRVYAAENKKEGAKQAFEMLVKEFPGDPAAQEAKSELGALAAAGSSAPANPVVMPGAAAARGAQTTASVTSVPESLPLLREVVERPWAPADVDRKEYALAPNIACTQKEVLARAQSRMLNQLQNFDKFMATEHIEHQQVDRYGNEGDLRAKDFSYLVFVHPFRKDSFFLEESRDGGPGVDSFPTPLATTGLVGLGVAILEREYEDDFDYKCEGLSSWRGQAAWQVRFEQRRERESRVRVWRRRGELFPVALKGRIWLAANSYDLLHMETDLRNPIEKLNLTRDHLMIDYGPVTFERGNEKLWLPWKAEMFMEIHGKRYHHRHTLTDYMLFSVDTTNRIGKPKLPPDDVEDKPQN